MKEICVNENKSIKEVMKIIDHSGLGIAFVTDKNNKFTGVITDGDVRRAILKGINLEEKIKKIMNNSAITVNEKWDEKEIKNILKKDDFSYRIPSHGAIKIPVLNKNKNVIDMLFATRKKCESYKKTTGQARYKIKPASKVLVVGGAGYLGSVLCRKLLDKGYYVRVLDNLTYGDDGINELYNRTKFEFIKGDMRDIQTVVDAVKDVDAVIHLAAIVGDPASALDPEETIEINYFGTKLLAEVCKYSQINRFIFASTCSVYGASLSPDIKINEKSQLNPVSLYAEMKLKSERGILEIADENFSPTILRMATLFGKSPRMRFDLVVNILTIKALKEKKFTIFGGEQWRPNLHVSDAAEAYLTCLEAPINKINMEIFNVGSNDENYKIREIGEMIHTLIPEAKMIIDEKKIDKRNYNISFDKIGKNLDYSIQYTIKDGIKELKKAVKAGKFINYTDLKYNNFKLLQTITCER